MGRGSTKALIRKIVQCLTEGPKSISEIEQKTHLDRTAIAKYLTILKESNLLVEEQRGTSKFFMIIPTYRSDTFFGLPLDEKASKNIDSLYFLISKNWKEISTKRLLKTHAQKIAYKVIERCKLDIPSGWYVFGGICVASFEENREYKYPGFDLNKDVEACVKEVTADYATNEFAWQSKKKQYDEGGRGLYKLKEDILAILYSSKFDVHPKNSLFVLVKKLRRLVQLYPKNIKDDYLEVLGAYQDLMLDITNKLDEQVILQHKRDILFLFEEVWKFIALFNFKNDLSKFYSEKILDIHFKLDINQQEDEIVELGTELQSLVPEEEIIDPLKKQIHEALTKIKPLSKEEMKTEKEKLEKLEKELGHNGFQEHILEQVGLK